MFSNEELESWCNKLNLKESARRLIKEIRSTEPVRQVGSSFNNVSGNYATSSKMGKIIKFESHKVELPAIEEYESDRDVIEYYDQPFRFTLKFKSKSGRTVTVSHVPDFFVIRLQSAGFEEWKTEKKLEELAEAQPNRYIKDNGQWHSPPAKEYGEKIGVYYRLRSDREINWVKYRNYQYLKSYIHKKYSASINEASFILEIVASQPGITYSDLLLNKEISADDINALIASKEIYVDLENTPLAEPEKVHIFRDKDTSDAYSLMLNSYQTNEYYQYSSDIAVGSLVYWDGKCLTASHIGETKIVFRSVDEKLISLSKIEFYKLVQLKEITVTSTIAPVSQNPASMERFLKASPETLAEANYRYQVIEPYLKGSKRENETVSERTIRDWKAKWKAALVKYNWGYVGLIENRAAKGNRNSKISAALWEFIDKVIEQQYETLKQKGKLAVYGLLASEWEKAGFVDDLPSFVTFCSRVKRRSGYQQTKKRQGNRTAYQKSIFYWELEFTTPRHGDRPFEVCHIDHTLLDIELVCSRTGRPLGRPWATLLIDAYSRRILAVYHTFDEPSYRSCMMVLRICVQRFSRLPETIVVDGGPEFSSTYFETLLAAFECTKKQRPGAKARFGSIIERIFGTSNTEFLHNLRGNTQITKNVRQVTKSNNPKNLAVWTLNELYEHFCAYSYEFYDCKEHPALVCSPSQAFNAGLATSGSRPQQKIVYDENFKIFTLPSTPKGTAKVQPSRGIKINYIQYWSVDNSFIRPDVEGTDVAVRYDPFDMGTAYAYVKGRWVRCISEYYKSFHNCSEREVKLASLQLHRSRHLHAQRVTISAKEKAMYLEGAEAKEALLLQRLHDLARGDVCSIIEAERTEKIDNLRHTFKESTDASSDDSAIEEDEQKNNNIDLNTIKPYTDEELW